jgi:putative oxygen-independent coproporphyrinogen III oxidase
MQLPPLSLYVHIPWCVRKCPYCDFNSHESAAVPETEYVMALLDDLHKDQAFSQGRKLHSIFFGGGTPSLFSADSIERILRGAEKFIGFEDRIEITLEVNPGTAEYDHLTGYHSAGVNRLSFGIQSFDDEQLRRLGRIHSSVEAKHAFAQARQAGFDNINLDLMHGLPEQTEAAALEDLRCAVALQPEHISWYQLTIEPNTVFYNRPPTLPNDDVLSDIQDAGHKFLSEHQFRQYEVSAYSRPGRQARHNLNYWEFGDYLAIGAGAHGKITSLDKQIHRYWKTRKPDDYLHPDKSYTAGRQQVPPNKQMLEFMMNGLRLPDGLPKRYFHERTELLATDLDERVNRLIARGLMENNPERLQPTALGLRFLNDVLANFDDDNS